MVSGLIATYAMSRESLESSRILYVLETVGLSTFGFAWIVAGKSIGLFVDEEQKLQLW